MTDETTTKAKSNSVVHVATTTDTITFEVKGAGRTILELGKLHADVRAQALIHGLKQRIADTAAMSRNPDTGKSASPQDKLAAMAELVNHYNSGTSEWRLKGKDRIGSDEVLLARALAEIYTDKSAEKVRAYVAGLTKPQRTALLMSDKVKPVADRMRQAETANVDADELLMGLETMPDDDGGPSA